jgi:hypothetical protein
MRSTRTNRRDSDVDLLKAVHSDPNMIALDVTADSALIEDDQHYWKVTT